MDESRLKNAVRNIIFGFFNKIAITVLPFISRTIILHLLGAEYLGVGTLFSSVLNFLSLAEMGFTAAIVYAMYKPIAENDFAQVGKLLKYFKKIYHAIGAVILIIGIVIVPIIPYLIKGNPPAGINVYILYLIYLMNSVLSYFFSGYKQCLLTANQRSDLLSKISTVILPLVQILQILVLYLTKNFYFFAFVPIFGTILNNIIVAYTVDKIYPEISSKEEISSEEKIQIKKKIFGLFGTKLNSIVIHSADVIIISAFLGLTLTAKYGNYYMVFNAVCGFIGIIFSSLVAGIGNKLVLDSNDENLKFFYNIEFINAFIVCVCCSCFMCLFEPFISIWVGEEMKLGVLFVVLMVIYFYIYEIQRTVLAFKDAAGLWEKDRFRPYCSMSINIVSNIVLVQFIGIYGIVVSTIIAFLVSLPWANIILFKNLFNISAKSNLKLIINYFIVTIISCITSYCICSLCPGGILGIAERLLISVLMSSAIFSFIFRRTRENSYFKELILSYLKIKRSE